MNGYDAQDMATQGAEGFRNGYQAGYADAVKAVEVGKPAAAQEAVAVVSAETFNDDGTSDIIKPSLPIGMKLYAAPVAAAPTLDAELAQDRMSELCELERDVLDSLPAVYYMDPPDGGNVSLGEQVKRMAEDAALWRKHSSTPAAPGIDPATAWAEGYESGVIDERTSEANIGIAGFGEKIAPARANPYLIYASHKGGSGWAFTAEEVNEVIDAALARGTRLIPSEAIEQMRAALLQATSAEVKP